MPFTQDARICTLLTPLPENTLVLQEFSGTEFINDISMFRVRAVAEKKPVDLDALLGCPMRVRVETKHGKRWFNLTVFSARYLGNETTNHFYEFELRPWYWALSKRENSRIFHDKTIEDIIGTVLREYAGLQYSDHKFAVQGGLPTLEYVVQYRETDLAFVRRLLEEYGLNFHLKMEENKQTLIMSNSNDGFVTVPGPARPFVPVAGVHEANTEHLHTWLGQRMVTTGRVRMTDNDFKKPKTGLEVKSEDTKGYANSSFESYDYPGRYLETGDGTSLVERRMAAYRTQDATVRADGYLMSLGAGMIFALSEHTTASENGNYVCLSAHHHFVDGGYRSGGNTSARYDGYYSLTKEASPIAPERVTPRGYMRGPQTAVVVNGGDSEVDEYGRIVVKFHWDTSAQSMKCRVSQMWAGPNWGTIFIPHVGMEVIVEFLNGDPDYPVVTGCVYNAAMMPPYPLPDKKLVSGVKTRNTNELTFDDNDGAEKIYIHARKDLEIMVENDESQEIRNNSKREITGTRTDKINKTEDITVVGARTVTVKSTETKKVTSTLSISSDTKIELKVGGSSITIDPTGIKITAVKIEILASAQLETNGSAMAKHTAGGVMQIQAP
ncbi:MAG: type VI secretion system Vgr family protein, partial [Paracoccaceae bacterium]